MAKSARSSSIKKNNQTLKKRVFGPVETARNERMSARLLALAQQPKPPRPEMEVDHDNDSHDPSAEAKEDNLTTKDVDMDVDGAATAKRADKSNTALKREKTSKAAKIEKKRIRKPRNSIVFKKNPKKVQTKKR